MLAKIQWCFRMKRMFKNSYGILQATFINWSRRRLVRYTSENRLLCIEIWWDRVHEMICLRVLLRNIQSCWKWVNLPVTKSHLLDRISMIPFLRRVRSQSSISNFWPWIRTFKTWKHLRSGNYWNIECWWFAHACNHAVSRFTSANFL